MLTDHEKDIMDVCGQVGAILLTSGAEIQRVEQTVEYIGRAAGLPLNCYVTVTAVFVSVNELAATMTFKTKLGGFNLQKVDEINQVSRLFTEKKIDFDTLKSRVSQIDKKVIDFNWPTKILGAGLVSVAPMFVFKATWGDLGLAFFIGIFGYLAAQFFGHHKVFPYLPELVGGFVIALLAIFTVKLGIGINSSQMIVSALMPLVPGVAITNSLREITSGELISGTLRAVDAILVAAAIGGGVLLATSIMIGIGNM